MKIKHQTAILFYASLIPLSFGMYFLFDVAIRATGEEIAKAWYYGEIANLQEGQILPAIAKNQNLLEKSPFVRSVVLVDEAEPQKSLFSVGEKAKLVSAQSLQITKNSNEDINHFRIGFLSYRLIAKLPGKNNLYIIYDVASTFLNWIYLFTLSLAIAFVGYIIGMVLNIKNTERKKRESIRTDLLDRLAHDVKSPLLGISNLSLKLKKLDHSLHISLEKSVADIRQLFAQTNKVDKKLLSDTEPILAIDEELDEIPIVPVLKEYVFQKRGEYSSIQDLEIDFHADKMCLDKFVKLNLDDLRRHLDNILKNSFEAMNQSLLKKVCIQISAVESNIELSIEDTGRGIPEDVLKNIGKKGVSFGKTTGKGLGLYYAFASIEHWNGKFEIQSKLNLGTKIKIILPSVQASAWYKAMPDFEIDKKIIVIDDDSTVGDRWNEKLSQQSFLHFNTTESFKKWFNEGGQLEDNLQFIFDYHLDGDNTGLNIIDELGLANESILVTSAYLDKEIRSRAQELNVSIMPKSLL